MKLTNPKNSGHLSILKKYRVLEVGGGNFPHKKAHVVVDKFVDSNFHRSGNLKVLKHQKFIQADGEQLPFKDKEFDYVICKHVLEHIENPQAFINEQTRVAPMGYMETPSLLGEYLAPKISHNWIVQDIDGKLVMYDKEHLNFTAWQDFGVVFLNHLPENSLGYKILQRTHASIMTTNYEWRDDIEFLINPPDSYYLDHFTKPWDEKMTKKLILSQPSYSKEVVSTILAAFDIMRCVIKSKILKRDS